jgi:hypothetical protein
MAWKVFGVDAKTRSGKFAQFVKYDDFSWPCPWLFRVEGEAKNFHYSVGGFIGNHQMDSHELDLIAPFSAGIELSDNEQEFLTELLAGTNATLGRDILDKIAASS